MEYIADLHIHSPYSRATSKTSHLFGLASWAGIKGISVLGTGDFTHPGWFAHLRENLEEAEPGFFRLQEGKNLQQNSILPACLPQPDVGAIRFVLTAEISSIYKKEGVVRKIHNLIFVPDFESVRRINATLAGIGNIESDGRPILGLDSRDLLEIVLEKAPGGFLVPAHIWTPWFSLFGSKSGFNAIEECFADLSEHIFALETGLSSDPAMNRLVSALDRFTLISNSDSHSPAKLGRESNIFTTDFNFFALQKAIRTPTDAAGHRNFAATVEFYPEEGKYHCDGHRKCGICLEPAETDRIKGICPVCGRPVTVGVLNRVMEMADRSKPFFPKGSPGVFSLVPLPEILGELLQSGSATKRVAEAYAGLVRQFGSEFDILLRTPEEDLQANASPLLAEAVRRVRTGRVIRKPGFDGEFGVIKVFSDGELNSLAGQLDLFGNSYRCEKKRTTARPRGKKEGGGATVQLDKIRKHGLNPEQQKAVDSDARHIIVKAGPGTGKTHTLVRRVARIMGEVKTPCTVITFTNKAADELRQRIISLAGSRFPVSISTLHGYCLHWLRLDKPAIRVAGPETRQRLLRSIYGTAGESVRKIDRRITGFLQGAPDFSATLPQDLEEYFRTLDRNDLVDIDAVVPLAYAMTDEENPLSALMREQTGALFIDEFQDLNQSQYELVFRLAATSPVFAIGDPDQAIYGFRGSSPVWFNRFIMDLDPEQHVLFRNYRCPARIVDASYDVIHHNRPAESSIRPVSQVEGAGTIFIRKNPTPLAEALFVVDQIESLVGGTSHREIDRLHRQAEQDFSLSDIAVLYRTARQAEILAETLSTHGFPVQVVDVRPFYQNGPTRLLYLWLLASAELADSADILDLVKLGGALDSKELDALEEAIPPGMPNPLENLDDLQAACSDRQFSLLREHEQFAGELRKEAGRGIGAVLARIVARTGIDENDPEVVHFFHLAGSFGTSLTGFADHLKRYGDSVVYDERAEVVTLMTMHAAKGLEFPVVFLVGMEEGILPLAPRGGLSGDDIRQHVEEERRLFYVGMTRAEKILYLTHAENRQVAGEMIQQVPSRFLQELPDRFISPEPETGTGRKKTKRRAKQLRLF